MFYKIATTILIILFAFLALATNTDHQAEQGTYQKFHKPLGVELWENGTYPATYPVWGYPVLVGLIRDDEAVEVLQVSTMLATILVLLWPHLDNPRSLIFAPLSFPVFAHASVKWPDAWYVISLLWLLYAIRSRRYWIAFLAGFVAASMRPDFLPFSVFALLATIIFTSIRKPIFMAFSGALVVLFPWFLITGSPTSTNGGHVLYISLGQLPDNPWHRWYDDRAAIAYLSEQGIDGYLTVETDQALMRAAVLDIWHYPLSYAKKVAHNLRIALIGGSYSGEQLPNFTPAILPFLAFLALRKRKDPAVQYAIALMVFTLVWVSALQYIDRHMSGVYAVFYSLAIINSGEILPETNTLSAPPLV